MNPCELFGKFKLEELHTDFYRVSHRNKLLAESFYLTGEVEKYGTGFIRIRSRLCEESPNTTIALSSESGAFTTSIGSIESTRKPSVKSSVKILDLLGKNSDMTIPELADLTGITTRGVEKSIRKLQEAGVLKRVGPDKGGHWAVLK
jgi:ATP-dependent DNA helicase RecG